MDAYLANIKAKTGKTWQDFKALAEAKGLVKHGDIIAWLKADFALGHGHANAIAHMVLHGDAPKVDHDEALAQHFAGAKASWRAAFDALVAGVKAFGPDVSVSSGKSYISLLRSGRKFGIVAITAKRLDVGIKLGGAPFGGRFGESGSWNAMVTHRVQVDDPSQIDAEVTGWLKQAYDKA